MPAEQPEPGTIDPVRHVVLLMLENHSFDQMIGCLTAVYPDLEGINREAARENRDHEGAVYPQAPTTERIMFLDPHHEVPHVAAQLSDHNAGFVRDFSESFPASTPEARGYIMGYYPLGFLPALHPLAREFTVCDRWFSSLPGPTWPNRFFALTGTSNGRVDMPDDGTHKADLLGYFEQTQDTLFDRLNEAAINWKVYFHDIPQTTVLTHQREPHNSARYFYIDEFFDDARGSATEFPQFCLIEPAYIGFAQNDDHPPHDVMRSEKLIADVYNAIRANENLWRSTLLIIFYDEHGGFYDHVEPPAAIPPDSKSAGYPFDRLGVRVPALLVSPWVDARVEHTVFDHSSMLRYLSDKWHLGPLGARTAAAQSIGRALARDNARTDALLRVELTSEQLTSADPLLEEKAFGFLSTHQTALHQLTVYLESEGVDLAPQGWSWVARGLMALRDGLNHVLDRALGLPSNACASIAEPDKIARSRDAEARNNVARFIMRKKRYAAMGLQTRLNDTALTPAQRDHALQTLALITGRRFHLEPLQTKFAHARQWLGDHL